MNPTRIVFILIALSAFLTSCASTKVADVWTNPEFGAQPLSKVVVLGVAADKTRRAMFETDFTTALREYGVKATAGSRVKALRGKLSKEKVLEAVAKMDVDSIIVTRFTSYDIDRKVYGGYTEFWIHSFPTAYGEYIANVHETTHPSYVNERTTLYLETSIFEPDGSAVRWSMRTKTKDPQYHDVAGDLIRIAMSQLRRDGLVR